MEDDSTKKRRGRKPKEESVVATTTATVIAEDSKGSSGKRGRKPKTIYNTYDVTNNATNPTSLSDDENIIVRLNVTQENTEFCGDVADEQHPYAYNRDEYRDILSLSEMNASLNSNLNVNAMSGLPNIPNIHASTHCDNHNHLKVVNILKDFEEKNKNKEWPSNTSISCYWCCHKFDSPPFGIPITFQNNVFYVFGCFCSLECAAAHNFHTTTNIDEMWERYNLINLLSRRLHLGTQIRPAPDRLALKMFGGYMEIDQFRNYTKTKKIININFPPMSRISQPIEGINEYELNNDYKYIPLDHDRINKIKEQMVIKRAKPLVNTKNSLETTMNLKLV